VDSKPFFGAKISKKIGMGQSNPLQIQSTSYNVRMSTIPTEIRGQKYISLTTYRMIGIGVRTPIWFGEEDGKLYFMTNSKSGKVKRLHNDLKVKIAPCTIRGKITGPDFSATARFMHPQEFAQARNLINKKYWLARIPFLWRKSDTYIELTPTSG
jgi:PPOX class probable F420-dependent enzyme